MNGVNSARQFDTAKVWKWSVIGGVAAGVANLILYLLTHAAGVDFIGKFQGPEGPTAPLLVPLVMISSVVPAVVAALVLTVLNRLMRAPAVAFGALSALFLAASMVGPFTVQAASPGTKIVLGLMHIVAALGILGGIFTKARA